jgi:hypothetical protein
MTKTETISIPLIRGINADLRRIIEGKKEIEILKLCLDLLTCHIVL